jgi:AcrR family transcriptional regulator
VGVVAAGTSRYSKPMSTHSVRHRLSAKERRDEIIDAACAVIATVGIASFRIRDVADEAGVSQPLVSSHFRSREELIEAAFERTDERSLALLRERTAGAASGRERIARFLACCLDDDPELTEGWNLWHQIWTFGAFSPALTDVIRTRQATWIGHVAERIRDGQADGSIEPDIDADAAATLLVIVLDGVAPQLAYGLLGRAAARALVVRAVADTLHLSSPRAAAP